MYCVFDFSIDKIVFLNNKKYDYTEDLLGEIIKFNEIYVVTYPGSYTGIRKSIAIVEAIKTYKPEINLFSINLLEHFGVLFSEKPIFYKENHIIHYYDRKTITLRNDLEEVLKLGIGNIENHYGEKIDFSIERIIEKIGVMRVKKICQEYYDRFRE